MSYQSQTPPDDLDAIEAMARSGRFGDAAVHAANGASKVAKAGAYVTAGGFVTSYDEHRPEVADPENHGDGYDNGALERADAPAPEITLPPPLDPVPVRLPQNLYRPGPILPSGAVRHSPNRLHSRPRHRDTGPDNADLHQPGRPDPSSVALPAATPTSAAVAGSGRTPITVWPVGPGTSIAGSGKPFAAPAVGTADSTQTGSPTADESSSGTDRPVIATPAQLATTPRGVARHPIGTLEPHAAPPPPAAAHFAPAFYDHHHPLHIEGPPRVPIQIGHSPGRSHPQPSSGLPHSNAGVAPGFTPHSATPSLHPAFPGPHRDAGLPGSAVPGHRSPTVPGIGHGQPTPAGLRDTSPDTPSPDQTRRGPDRSSDQSSPQSNRMPSDQSSPDRSSTPDDTHDDTHNDDTRGGARHDGHSGSGFGFSIGPDNDDTDGNDTSVPDRGGEPAGPDDHFGHSPAGEEGLGNGDRIPPGVDGPTNHGWGGTGTHVGTGPLLHLHGFTPIHPYLGGLPHIPFRAGPGTHMVPGGHMLVLPHLGRIADPVPYAPVDMTRGLSETRHGLAGALDAHNVGTHHTAGWYHPTPDHHHPMPWLHH